MIRRSMIRFAQIAFLVLVCGVNVSAQQPQERTLKWWTPPNLPLEIFNLRVGGRAIAFNQKFTADDDWVKNLSFDVRNISGKVITHFEIGLMMPAGQEGKPSGFVYMMSHGAAASYPGVMPTIRMIPGEEVHASYTDKMYKGFEGMRDHVGLTKVTELTLRIESVLFEDELMWRHGSYLRRNPDNPRSWVVIGRETFVKRPSESPVTTLKIADSANVTVAAQPGVPLLISLNEVFRGDPDKPQLNFQIENLGAKAIRTIAIRYDELYEKSRNSGLVYDKSVPVNPILKPGQWQGIGFGCALKSEPLKGIVLSVDFIEFEDGTTWEADTLKSRP